MASLPEGAVDEQLCCRPATRHRTGNDLRGAQETNLRRISAARSGVMAIIAAIARGLLCMKRAE
jgi:hypothetical protein